MKYNIDVLYICNRNANKKGCIGCDPDTCNHTLYPEYAKNKESAALAEEFFRRFKPVYGPEDHLIGYEEQEEE